MSEIKNFLYGPENVRIVERDGEPWFVAADVCRVLGIANPTDTLRRLDEDERTLEIIEGASNGLPVNIVSESGLYSLIFRSNKTEAKNFKRWVTHEVLPSIRKAGQYSTLPVPSSGSMPPIVVLEQFFNALKDHDERLTDHASRIEAIEKSRRLEYWQLGRLQSAVRQVTARWRQESERRFRYDPQYATVIYAVVKRRFGRVPRIQEIPAIFFEDAIKFVESIGTYSDFVAEHRNRYA